MSVVNSAYTSAGLKGIVELYVLFPDRLREKIIRQHAMVFRQLWQELSTSERQTVDEYVLDGDVEHGSEVPESVYYAEKIRDLEENYQHRRSIRIREVANYDPEVATALILDFEKAVATLIQINRDLLAQSKQREAEILRREQEAILFEPSEHSGLCTIQL